MMNHDLFLRDPRTSTLRNDGQARIVDDQWTPQAQSLLRYELEHFVCEGQYAVGLQRIFDAFLTNLGGGVQRAAWVSGFYGSGKSHLLKMLAHLWANTTFDDGLTARSLVSGLPADLTAALKELDNQGRRSGGGLLTVSGTMPEGTADSARLTVLACIFRATGLPAAYHEARFCLYLKDKNLYDAVKAHLVSAGRTLERELTDLFVSPHLRRALAAVDPGLGSDKEIRDLLRTQFSPVTDLDTNEFLRVAKEALTIAGRGSIPLTTVILDEVQHYIGNNQDRSRAITELTEALNKQFQGRLLVVAAGQNALSTDTPQFAWLRDRFTIRVELSDADVETVTRKVILAKRPETIAALEAVLERSSGEISRHLAGTNIAPGPRDQQWLVADYPILPVRRRLWEAALRAVDPTGSSSPLRSQLRMTHEALREVAEKPLGSIVPADFMFFQQQTALVQQGVLPREISDRILRLDDGTSSGRLKSRVCGLVFLIRRLSRDKAVDTGVRATTNMLADLLTQDLTQDGANLRRDLPQVLAELVQDGVLLSDGHEYNLQTRESAQWEDDFRSQLVRLRAEASFLSQERRARLRAMVDAALKPLRLVHGSSRTARDLVLHFGAEEPQASTTAIQVWIRDGWEIEERAVLARARAAGTDSPLLFVFLPQQQDELLREHLLRNKASRAVLDLKGPPTGQAAEEAAAAMQARANDADRSIQHILTEILATAKVWKGGGTELNALSLLDKLTDAAQDAVTRLFPRFTESDHRGWESAAERVKKGDDAPMAAVDWRGPTEEHPVCKEILSYLGPGREGRHILAHFQTAPFGWSKDTVNAALVCLVAAGRVKVQDSTSGQAIEPKHLDHPRINKATFSTQSIALSVKDKIALRGLFTNQGLRCQPADDLAAKGAEFKAKIQELASKAGGDAPLPPRPGVQLLSEISPLSGNELLAAYLSHLDTIKAELPKWNTAAELAAKRLPQWNMLEELLTAGVDFSSVTTTAEVITSERRLLDPTDHVEPLLKIVRDGLRSALLEARGQYTQARQRALARLETNTLWGQLGPAIQTTLLNQHPIPDLEPLEISDDQGLRAALTRTPLAWWRDRSDSLEPRVDLLITEAAKILTPTARRITLPSATIQNPEELETWIAEVRQNITQELAKGAVRV